MKHSLLDQWIRFLELPSAYSRFTVDIYESMYPHGSFIAHFNREGFFKARFWTLIDFDNTLDMMSEVKELKTLLDKTPIEVLANARYKIACLEANITTQQAKVMLEHVQRLQHMFSKSILK